ncbi:MAG: FecR domain-containing protein [Spirochaetes bacterium]|nr:FecR domain-containing protein [Spirochaetota bacterium]
MNKRMTIGMILLLSAFPLFAADVPFGTVDYVEGDVTITRSGKTMNDLNIGDSIAVNDMIKTGNDGALIIALDKRTGMRGTLVVKAKSVAYIRLTEDATSPKTTIDLVAGSVASKVAKLSGSPSMQVQTASAVMGVRGTEYGVAASVNGSIMAWCAEGMVECSDGTDTVPLPPGKAVEKQPSERLRLMPVAVSTPEEFEKQWIAEEIQAFRSGGVRLVQDYEKRYIDLYAQFNKQFDALQKSSVLGKWLSEDKEGRKINPNDPATMRDKKDMIGPIMDLRKNLFIFERIYYRLEEIDGIVTGTPIERAELRPGIKVSDFFKRFRADRDALARKVALFRYAEKLYELRNQGGAGLPGSGGLSDDDFFGSSDF